MKKCTLNSIIRLGIFGAITLVTNLAFGQGSTAFANPVVTNSLGQPIAGATVAVCKSNPGVSPTALCSGATLATTYTDITIGTACTGTLQALNNQTSPSVGSGCSNPGLADGVGNVIVFSTSATYWCEYSGRGIIGIIVQVCVVPNSGGSGPAGAVLVIPTLTQDQSVIQPSVGGVNIGTSLNANVFEQVRYADQFQWSQSPAGSIAVGANTITINQLRGIAAQSAYPGINAGGTHYYAKHQIRVAGTGTPEVVTITATTCTGASTGTCTITFTAANTHSAGYTVGTATGGFAEANIDCYSLFDGGAFTNVTSACVLKGSPFTLHGHYVFYGTWNMENLGSGQIELDCQSATLEDNVSGDAMIVYGGGLLTGVGTATGGPEQGLIHNCHFAEYPGIGRSATGAQVFLRDYGQNLAVRENTFNGADAHAGDFLDSLIWVSADQGFILDHNDFSAGNMGKCDGTFCGPAVLGDGIGSAAIGTIFNNEFINVSGFSTAVEWDSGNGLTLRDNIFQNWVKYPWRYQAGLVAPSDQGGNYYEGAAAIVNPDFGLSGYSQNTGPQIGLSGTQTEYKPGANRGQNGLGIHRFSSTGANVYSYYIVGHDGSGHQTRPLFVGDAATDGVTNFNVLYLKFGAATYDVLRTGPAANDGNDAAPFASTAPLGNWAVATGVVCAANPCSYTETFAAPTAYAVLSESSGFAYCPGITYWPVPLFLMGNCAAPSTYIGPQVNGFVNNSSQGNGNAYYDAIFTSSTGGTGNITGMHIKFDTPLISGGHDIGALILNPDDMIGPYTLHKGRLNFASYSQQGATSGPLPGMTNNLLVQTFDFEANKTLAAAGHRPALNAKDHGIGYDTDGSYQMTMCGATSCSWYVNHVPDSGTSAVFQVVSTGPKTRLQFTSTIATGTTPFVVTSTTPVVNLAATPTTYNAAGTQQVNAHLVVGSCVLGTSCAVTLVGSAVFTGAATYSCTAEDNTAAAATKIVQASGSAFTITGTGTDALSYTCAGN